MSWKLWPCSRGTVSRSSAGPSPPRTWATASSISRAASAGSVPSPERMWRLAKLARLRGDVAARRLVGRRHRDAVLIVLDVEEHRQLLGGGDGQRRPEAVGRARWRRRRARPRSPRHRLRRRARRDDSRIACAQPAVGVYCAPTPPHIGKRRAAVRVRIVEHDADVAPVRIAAGAAHARAERVGRAARRARAAAAASDNSRRRRRGGWVEPAAEHDLRHVVAARAELVEDLARRGRARSSSSRSSARLTWTR